MPTNNTPVCHPERSRNFFERGARRNRGAIATKGSTNEFRWLTNGMLHPLKKTPRLHTRSRFALWLALLLVRLRSTRKSSTSLRMTDSGFIGLYSFVLGMSKAPSPTVNFHIICRGDHWWPPFHSCFSTFFREKPLIVVKFSKTRLLTFIFDCAIIMVTIGPIVAENEIRLQERRNLWN